MSVPMIGVVPLFDIQRDSLWMVPGYMDGVYEAGGLPVILPLVEDPWTVKTIADTFDGFLFTGGQDVDPALYGEEVFLRCGEVCNVRDTMEGLLFKEALDRDKPMLGICRGIQVFNVLCGGTLFQDLPSQHRSGVEHRMKQPYDRPAHMVNVVRNSPLHALLDSDQLEVNSCHHQAIKTLAPGLSPMGWSEDGLVEAVYMPEKRFVWGLQWHPELDWRTRRESREIFENFIRRCMKMSAGK